MREEIIGNARLLLGDCRDILPSLGRVDAVVTDPPYGIGATKKRTAGSKSTTWEVKAWDDSAPDLSFLPLVSTIVWGGNYFKLPPSRGWLVWDKKFNQSWYSTAHFELAWTNIDRNGAIFRLACVEAFCEPHSDGKFHPTQKPTSLMKWCLGFVPDAKTILDPFMGSGTTGVAAVQLGKRFIGIEREPSYFDIACRRIEAAYKQPDMFVSQPAPKPVQETML